MAMVLRIDADSDLTTNYLQAFRQRYIFEKFDHDWPKHKLLSFIGVDATEANIEDCLNTHPINYISGAGHGYYDTFTVYERQPLWIAKQNLSFLQGKIVHLLSCQTAAMLGKEMVKHGVAAFWGYTINFTFWITRPAPEDLSQDWLAEVPLRMDCIIDRGILAGLGAILIYQSVEKYVTKVLPQLGQRQRAVLLDNYLHLACPMVTWGDRVATI